MGVGRGKVGKFTSNILGCTLYVACEGLSHMRGTKAKAANHKNGILVSVEGEEM